MIEFLKKLSNINYVQNIRTVKSRPKINNIDNWLKDYQYEQYQDNDILIEDYDLKFNLINFLNSEDLTISVLFKTNEADSILKFIANSLSNTKSEIYFSEEMVKNFKLSYLNDLKDREIRSFTNYHNHSFIKFANNDYVILYTITKGINLKSLYILRKEDLILVEEFCYNKSFICDSNETFGLGYISKVDNKSYSSTNIHNTEVFEIIINKID